MDVSKIRDPALRKALQRKHFAIFNGGGTMGGGTKPAGETPGTTNQENDMTERQLTAALKPLERRLAEIEEVVENSKPAEPKRVNLGFTPRSTLTPTSERPCDKREREDTGGVLGFVPRSTLTPSDRRR